MAMFANYALAFSLSPRPRSARPRIAFNAAPNRLRAGEIFWPWARVISRFPVSNGAGYFPLTGSCRAVPRSRCGDEAVTFPTGAWI